MVATEPVRTSPVCVWTFRDGKPGHENQTRGLLQALQRRVPLELHNLPVLTPLRAVWTWITGQFPEGTALPPPQLIVGAGHRTHWSLLAARRGCGGRTVVLMKPSLPLGWFDLCLVPAHDGVALAPNVVVTRGVLNAVVPHSEKLWNHGLFLIGGPSVHHGWSDDGLFAQLEEIIAGTPSVAWSLTTSRRTPRATEARLQALARRNVSVIPFADTDPNWLPKRLQAVGYIWVTEDSVSMLYEALTSGAACGVLAIPRKHSSRVERGVAQLIEEGKVTSFAQWQQGCPLAPPADRFYEAGRCADEIISRWFSARSR